MVNAAGRIETQSALSGRFKRTVREIAALAFKAKVSKLEQ